jgi:Group II intron, maturase-specific domain/WYL domain
MHRHPDLIGTHRKVAASLARKCAHAGISIPGIETIQSSPFREEIEREWKNMLGHQLPEPLPPFASFWSTLGDVFNWLSGTTPVRHLPRASFGDLDPGWQIPQAITSWRRGIPLELLRYAGVNRLRVEVDYRAENGRLGPRKVEPYSLRRTRDGDLVLFVVNDRGQLRSYRIDRIARIRPTTGNLHAQVPGGILISHLLQAEERIRELTVRSRLLLPPEAVVQDINMFLRGWVAYFRYGQTAVRLAKIRDYATLRLAIFIGKRHKRGRRYGLNVVAYLSPDRYGLISMSGVVVPPRANKSWRNRPHAAGERRR